MAKTVPFKLITPTHIAFEGDAELVIAVRAPRARKVSSPSMPPFLTALRPGILRANIVEGEQTKRLEFATSEGFMQALPDRVTVLVDAALTLDQIDAAAARKELEAATERQRSAAPQSLGYAREQAAIDFANAKLARGTFARIAEERSSAKSTDRSSTSSSSAASGG